MQILRLSNIQHPDVTLCMQFRQKLANFAVFCARQFFDRITSYNLESMNERKWLRRILFLETVAGTACVLQACHCVASSLPVCSYICICLHVGFCHSLAFVCLSVLICVAYTLCNGGHYNPSIACTSAHCGIGIVLRACIRSSFNAALAACVSQMLCLMS